MTEEQAAQEFSQSAISELVKLQQKTKKIPTDTDYRFFSSYASFRNETEVLSDRVLTLLDQICNFVQPSEKKLKSFSDINRQREVVQDTGDMCLEQIDTCLDKIRGYNRDKTIGNTSNVNMANFKGGSKSFHKLRPQSNFIDDIDNSRDTPFRPKITEKPNAKQPLDTNATHPYKYEIESLEYASSQLCHRKVQSFSSIKQTPCYWVDSVEQLDEMVENLRHVKSFAVDLEHHNIHTFQGLTCLMQISTRHSDYIVDTLALRRELRKLNVAFTDPNIVKVFHGSHSDIIWLQRDLGIYVVNMFDTQVAGGLLGLPKRGLAYLLKQYCGVTVDKRIRLNDWRTRPLRETMLNYARSDTHYLLYIYDTLSNALIDTSNRSKEGSNLLLQCLKDSSEICLQTHIKPEFDPKGWMGLCRKYGWYLTKDVSLRLFPTLYEWRDALARELDESCDYILPSKLMGIIVTELPINRTQLEQVCHPIPRGIQGRVGEILELIQNAISSTTKPVSPMFEVQEEKTTIEPMDIDQAVTEDVSKDGIITFDQGITFENVSMDFRPQSQSNVTILEMPKNLPVSESFLPISDEKPDPQTMRSQTVANEIFDQLRKEPILQLIKRTTVNPSMGDMPQIIGAPPKRSRKSKKAAAKLAATAIPKPTVDTEMSDHKLSGSKLLSTHNKDVFTLPRNKLDSAPQPKKRPRKRRASEKDSLTNTTAATEAQMAETVHSLTNEGHSTVGPVLEPPNAKRRKIERRNSSKKQSGLATVNAQWPYKGLSVKPQTKRKKHSPKKKKTEKSIAEESTSQYETRNKFGNDITEEDLWEKAPMPRGSAVFGEVFDPHGTYHEAKARNEQYKSATGWQDKGHL